MTYTLKKKKCNNFDNHKITCYTKKKLINIAKKWNNDNPNKKIKYIQNKTKFILWNDLKNNFNTNREEKWLQFTSKPFLENISNYRDKTKGQRGGSTVQSPPRVPKEWKYNKNKWLSNIDISKAMKYYQDKYKRFHFIDPAPIDFDEKDTNNNCLHSKLCKYNYESLYRKYDYFGIIFNTDPHDKPGQHWIALFIHLKKGEISFFDSTGDQPPDEIQEFINKFEKEGKQVLGLGETENIKININKMQHQKLDSECGIYCLAFIHHMLVTDGDFSIFSTVEVFWNNSLPPQSDKELQSQLSKFGDVTQTIITDNKGIVMFSDYEEAQRCVNNYKGPWSINVKRISDDKIEFLRGFFFNDVEGIYSK